MNLTEAIAASEAVTAFLRAQQAEPAPTPTPVPPPVVTPPPVIAPAADLSIYNTVVRAQGVFPGARMPNQRQYLSMTTRDLLSVAFVAPPGATALGIAVSAQGPQRNFEWAVSTAEGDFANALYRGTAVDLAATFTTTGFVGAKVLPARQPLFLNLRYEDRSAADDASVVVFFQHPL